MHTVLVVDDDDDIRDGVQRMLEDEGYATRGARNGCDALSQLRADDALPCMILTDFVMPMMNGKDLLAAIARDARLRSIPTLVMSAREGPFHLGETEVMRKPFEFPRLLAAVQALCGLPHPGDHDCRASPVAA